MSYKIFHISIDDCIDIFKDVSINSKKYTSIFDNDIFSFFRSLRNKYSIVLSLYSFFEHNGFKLSDMTAKYKKDFLDNKEWLKIGFHGLNKDKNYQEDGGARKDYNLFVREVIRFGGSYEIIDRFPRLHRFLGSVENILDMKKSRFGVIGLLSSYDYRENYYLEKNENTFLNKQFVYNDIKNDILFFKTNLKIEDINDMQLMLNKIDSDNNLIVFTHERYLYEDIVRKNIEKICDYSIKNNYRFDFPQNVYDSFIFKRGKIKRFIDAYIPVTTCNLRCPYCYITQSSRWSDELPNFKYSQSHVRKALSKNRLGGVCLINMCAGGETLLHPYIVDLIKELLEEGHYIWVITNGTLTKRFDEIISLPKDLLLRLGFKFSFHYLELKRLNKTNEFINNIIKVKDKGCSFSLEITPHDELIEYIDEIKDLCYKKFGALCHITVAREDNHNDKNILTKLLMKEYERIWSVFDSKMFSFKLSTFNVKRKEYCHGGCWTMALNIGSGVLKQCYSSFYEQNIFEDIDRPIEFREIGKKCLEPHCYNSHAFLTLGAIAKLKTPYYFEMRNRVCKDGSEWLNPYMKEFLSHKLCEENKKFKLL